MGLPVYFNCDNFRSASFIDVVATINLGAHIARNGGKIFIKRNTGVH
jgi:hypothetical protein